MRVALVGFALVTTVASSAAAADRHPTPSIPWIVTQAIPSPAIAVGDERSVFALRWQLTPYLYSWGIHRNAPRRFRAFVVEPPMRHSGSFELFAGPEWLNDVGWFARFGARTHVPVVDRGEALALSIGASGWTEFRRVGPSFELGAHTLFGMLGLLVGYSPTFEAGKWMFTLQVRVL